MERVGRERERMPISVFNLLVRWILFICYCGASVPSSLRDNNAVFLLLERMDSKFMKIDLN